MLAQIALTYQVPLDMLDTVLSESMRSGMQGVTSQNMPPVDPQQIADQAAQRAFEQMQRAQSEQAYQQEFQSATGEINSFIKENPVAGFPQMRNSMADLIEMDPNMTLQEAFDNAILRHPELQQYVAPRQPDAQQHELQQARSKRSKRAASSVKSSPTTGAKSTPDTLRGALEEAFEDAG